MKLLHVILACALAMGQLAGPLHGGIQYSGNLSKFKAITQTTTETQMAINTWEAMPGMQFQVVNSGPAQLVITFCGAVVRHPSGGVVKLRAKYGGGILDPGEITGSNTSGAPPPEAKCFTWFKKVFLAGTRFVSLEWRTEVDPSAPTLKGTVGKRSLMVQYD